MENARQDRVHANALAHQVARDGQGHAGNAGLGCGIGRLPDLSVLRRDRCGHHHRSAFAVVVDGVQVHHPLRRLGHALERADQVDVERLAERADVEMRCGARLAVAAHGLAGGSDPGAAHQHPLLPVGFARLGKAGIDRSLVGHVDLAEDAADLFRNRLPARLVEIEQGHFRTLCRQRPCASLAKAGRSAGNDGDGGGIDLHGRQILRKCWLGPMLLKHDGSRSSGPAPDIPTAIRRRRSAVLRRPRRP